MSTRTTLGEILPVSYGKARAETCGVVRQETPVYGSSGEIGSFNRALTKGPALIVGRKGSAGAVFYAPEPCWPIDTVYFTEGNDRTYLPYFRYLLESLALGRFDRSTAVPSLSRDDYNSIAINVPTVDEQRRIVDEIEVQLSRLEAGVAALKRVQANLKRYRTSVMDSIFSGYIQPSGVSAPSRWVRTKLGHLGVTGTTTVQTGPFGAQLHNTEFVSEGIPVIAVGNLTGTGFTTEGLYFITAEKAASLRRYDVQAGDLLFARSGATLGKVCLAPDYVKDWRMTGHILRARLDSEKVDSRFVLYALAGSADVRRQVFGSVRGVTRPGFNTALLESIEIPLPPKCEQETLVAEIERRLSVVEELETQVHADLARAVRLRASVLSMAFQWH